MEKPSMVTLSSDQLYQAGIKCSILLQRPYRENEAVLAAVVFGLSV